MPKLTRPGYNASDDRVTQLRRKKGLKVGTIAQRARAYNKVLGKKRKRK